MALRSVVLARHGTGSLLEICRAVADSNSIQATTPSIADLTDDLELQDQNLFSMVLAQKAVICDDDSPARVSCLTIPGDPGTRCGIRFSMWMPNHFPASENEGREPSASSLPVPLKRCKWGGTYERPDVFSSRQLSRRAGQVQCFDCDLILSSGIFGPPLRIEPDYLGLFSCSGGVPREGLWFLPDRRCRSFFVPGNLLLRSRQRTIASDVHNCRSASCSFSRPVIAIGRCGGNSWPIAIISTHVGH